jgi:phosphate/sulfate permease
MTMNMIKRAFLSIVLFLVTASLLWTIPSTISGAPYSDSQTIAQPSVETGSSNATTNGNMNNSTAVSCSMIICYRIFMSIMGELDSMSIPLIL